MTLVLCLGFGHSILSPKVTYTPLAAKLKVGPRMGRQFFKERRRPIRGPFDLPRP